MTKLLLLKLIICISIVSSFGQKKEVEIAYKDGIKAIYECNDGILNGKYQSYYSNGQKCAEGNFKDNFRIGKWSVWDSEGK